MMGAGIEMLTMLAVIVVLLAVRSGVSAWCSQGHSLHVDVGGDQQRSGVCAQLDERTGRKHAIKSKGTLSTRSLALLCAPASACRRHPNPFAPPRTLTCAPNRSTTQPYRADASAPYSIVSFTLIVCIPPLATRRRTHSPPSLRSRSRRFCTRTVTLCSDGASHCAQPV